jgi:hypothetical protein
MDKPASPRGVAASIGGDRHWWPLCREHGHRLVTSSMVGGHGTGYQGAWLKRESGPLASRLARF